MTNNQDLDKTYPLPPGSFGLPFIGETISFLRDPHFADKRQEKYGAIFKTQILGRPTAIMMGAEANRFILSSHMDHFSWRNGWPNTFKELLGNSLFLQEGEEHRRNRKLLMPAFHGAALANYISTMENIIKKYLEKWEKLGTFTWFTELKQMTFEIASTLLIGSETGDLTASLSHLFTELTNGLFSIPINWSWTTYGKALKARDRLLDHIEKAVLYKQEHPASDALGLLVQSRDEDGKTLSLEEIKVQALLMLFAGHETTTSMLTSLCMAIAQYPDILTKLRAEQQNLSTSLSLNDLKQMSYTEQVLKEVERLYPPIGGGFRGVIKPFVFNNYYVPQGWLTLYRINSAHQDSRIYTHPEKFDPDRFSLERSEQKNMDYSLVGFGGGSRICLGLSFAQMEMKIFVAHLLRQYTWEILPGQDLTLNTVPTLRPQSGLKVKFSRNK